MHNRTRRDFLLTCASAAAIAPALLPHAAAQTAAPAASTASTPPAATEPLGAIHVFSKPLREFDYRETADLLAEAGFGGIDYLVRSGGHIDPKKAVDELPRAVEIARAAGLRVDMITTGIVDAHDAITRPLLECAVRLGIKVYRLGSYSYDLKTGVTGTIAKLKPVLRDLAQLNAELGIHGAIQNHTGRLRVGAPVWDLYELLRDMDPRWIGCQHDIRHATVEGGESWFSKLELIRPWIRSTDLKDFRWDQSPGKSVVVNTPIGEGIVDFARYFDCVRDWKIGGPQSVHLEYAPFENGPSVSRSERRALFLTAMKKDRAALRTFMQNAKLAG